MPAVQAPQGTVGLTAAQVDRYRRQMVLPELGVAGQRRLLDGRALVIGAGALGSTAALYLAAAGVGTVAIVDGDEVEASNLHRQVLHTLSDIGRAKTESARHHLSVRNPDVRVVQHREFLTKENAMELVSRYDVVVNGSDNFPTRYLVNDACVLRQKPLVDAAILRFEGQFAVYVPGQGCYRCLFPTPPPPESVANCAEAGVLGALAGVMASMQAVEALKLITGIGRPAAGRFLLFDAMECDWQSMSFARDPECPACGDHPTVTALLEDYEGFCNPAADAAGGPVAAAPAPVVSPAEARARLSAEGATLIDVRSPAEFQAGHIPGAVSVPLEALLAAPAAAARGAQVMCVCAVGKRSATAAAAMRAVGVDAYSVDGGTLAWVAAGLPWEGA